MWLGEGVQIRLSLLGLCGLRDFERYVSIMAVFPVMCKGLFVLLQCFRLSSHGCFSSA